MDKYIKRLMIVAIINIMLVIINTILVIKNYG